MENESKKLIVIFPGRGYTLLGPLLYYAALKYEDIGYTVMGVDYGNLEDIDEIRNFAMGQLKDLNLSIYDEIVFLSKSMGTVIAGWIADTLDENIRHIYMTPIESSLLFLKNDKNIEMVIVGTDDPLLDMDKLTKHCDREKIELKLIEGADHSLEIPHDIDKSIEILKYVVKLL